jgi:hypothetical protein
MQDLEDGDVFVLEDESGFTMELSGSSRNRNGDLEVRAHHNICNTISSWLLAFPPDLAGPSSSAPMSLWCCEQLTAVPDGINALVCGIASKNIAMRATEYTTLRQVEVWVSESMTVAGGPKYRGPTVFGCQAEPWQCTWHVDLTRGARCIVAADYEQFMSGTGDAIEFDDEEANMLEEMQHEQCDRLLNPARELTWL